MSRTNAWCHTYECVTSHIWMNHATCEWEWVAWFIHMFDVNEILPHMSASCDKWTRHNTCGRLMPNMNEMPPHMDTSLTMWMNHVTYKYTMPHMNKMPPQIDAPRGMCILHVTHTWLMPNMDEMPPPTNALYHIWTNHVTYEWVVLRTNESCRTYEWVMRAYDHSLDMTHHMYVWHAWL